MPSDDLSSQDPGPHPSAESARIPGPETDELDDVMERLESGSWDPFEDTPMPQPSARQDEAVEREGPILGFLERQLRERPLPTLLAAVAAGWLVGKLLR